MSDQPGHDPRYDELARQYEQRRPVRVTPLEYYGGRMEPRIARTPVGLQYFLGLVMPCAYVFAATLLPAQLNLQIWWLHVIVIVTVAGVIRNPLHWRGFMPGVLTALLLTPVAFFVLCCIALSRI